MRNDTQLSPEVRKMYALGQGAGMQEIGNSIVPPESQIPEKAGIPMPDHAKRRLQELMGGYTGH